MSLTLYAHPFSSYCWKVLIALYENATPFRYRALDEEGAMAELLARWPLGKFPVLVDGEATRIESSVIIEHLALHHPGPASLMPQDADAALEVRCLDRFFDNYVMTPMQKLVSDRMRASGESDARGVADARALLDRAYDWLEKRLGPGSVPWAAGAAFTLADCAAAPALFYADWVHRIGDGFPAVRDYRRRLLSHPSVARAVEEARPYRKLFPGGAPERD